MDSVRWFLSWTSFEEDIWHGILNENWSKCKIDDFITKCLTCWFTNVVNVVIKELLHIKVEKKMVEIASTIFSITWSIQNQYNCQSLKVQPAD